MPTSDFEERKKRMNDTRDQAVASLESQLGRCDTKASLLLGLSGALVAVIATAGTEHPPPPLAAAVGVAALVAITVATGLLLAAVRPHTRGGQDRASWPHWAQCTPEQIAQELGDDTDRRPAQIAALSRLTAAKYRRIRQAVDALAVGMGLLALAALLAAALTVL